MKLAAFAAPTLVVLSTFATAGTLSLDKSGGGLPGVTSFTMNGDPSRPYMLLFNVVEQQVVVNPNVTLAIAPTYAHLSAALPGFTGMTNGAGAASLSIPVPADPILQDLTVSFQAILGPVVDTASNLVRVTFATPGTFEPTLDTPDLPVAGGVLATQPDGSVLLLGGSGPVAQKYDPRVEEFELAGATFGVGVLAQSLSLADGRVFFSGGLGLDGQPTDAAAIYDPATQTTTTLTMNAKRAGHAAALMPNGKVLITGGFASFDVTDVLAFLSGVQPTSEIFDPIAQTFTNGPNMLEPRALHSATTLSNGGVLVAGGLTLLPIVNIPTVSATAYEYNPTLNTFGIPKFFSGARMLHSAVALSDGKALLVGGLSVDFSAVLTSGDLTQIVITTLSDVQRYTPGFFGGFSSGGTLSVPRAGAGVVALPGGKALIAGGFDLILDPVTPTVNLTPSSAADLYAAPATIAATGSMAAARILPLLSKLNDGTVLVVGGGPADAEVYQP
ncbi:MAG: hypothetical protein JNL94_00465 [Planctomycetes bacterium]|nr:hypothetical protein [Planctomycetota bacterium]